MGKEFDEIDASMRRWIERQHVFFVSTAPLAADGLVNCSPKGLDSLRILGPRSIAYADTGGSGIETVAHLKENGRIVIMLCAFDGPPRILRFYGTGRAVEAHDDEYETLLASVPDLPTIRNFILIDVARIRDACGYGVPLYEFKRERDSLQNWVAQKSPGELLEYRVANNAQSLDGLPGLDVDKLTLTKT